MNKFDCIKNKGVIFFITHFMLFNFDYYLEDKLYIKYSILDLIIDNFSAILGVVFVFEFIQYLFSRFNDSMNRFVNNKLINKFHNYSLYIYLIHQPIMLMILKLLKDFDIPTGIVYNVLFWFTLVISFGFCEVFNLIIKTFKLNINNDDVKIVLKGEN